MKEKIKFKDLSTPLKVLVVFGWILFGLYIFSIITGILVVLGGA